MTMKTGSVNEELARNAEEREQKPEPLMIDELRYLNYQPTGIYVRAKHVDGGFESVDISQLTKSSLLNWLRSRGGNNVWAENVVGLILGYGALHIEQRPISLKATK